MKFVPHFALVSAFMLGQPGPAAAEDVATVPSQGSAMIDRHGTCRVLGNRNSDALAVPVASALEWSLGENSFLYADRANISVDRCPVPRAMVAGSGQTFVSEGNGALFNISGHYCAIHDEQVYCFGAEESGQTGPNPTGGNWAPALVPLPALARAVFASDTRSCAITIDHDLYCWGSGYGATPVFKLSNVLTMNMGPTMPDSIGIAGNQNESCAATFASDVYCWVNNQAPALNSIASSITGPINALVAGWNANVRRNQNGTKVNLSILGSLVLSDNSELLNYAYHSFVPFPLPAGETGAPTSWGDPRNTRPGDIPTGTIVGMETGQFSLCFLYSTRRIWCTAGQAPGGNSTLMTPSFLQSGATVEAFAAGSLDNLMNSYVFACAAVSGDSRGDVYCKHGGTEAWFDIPGDVVDIALNSFRFCAMTETQDLYCGNPYDPGAALRRVSFP